MTRVRAHLVVVGDELLSGACVDENSPFLCGAITEAGGQVASVQIVRDDADHIAQAVRTVLTDDPGAWVLTTGGIGPTPDDVTYRGVAQALERPLETHPGMMSFVRSWSRDLRESSPEFTAMSQMALAPAGAYLVPGAEGVGPALAVDVANHPTCSTIVMLPGVPEYVAHLAEEFVIPRMMTDGVRRTRTAVVEHSLREAFLGPVFDVARERHAGVSVGSYVGPPRRLVVHGRRDDVDAALRDIEALLDRIASHARFSLVSDEHRGGCL